VLGISIIKVNDHFTLNDVTLVDKLKYNLLSDSQLVNADLNVLFHKSGSRVLSLSISFMLSMVLINSFLPHVFLNGMESWNERTTL
jgi:hypothetical protein